MSKVIMTGCDLHDRSMLIRYAVQDAAPQQATFANNAPGRRKMIELLKGLAETHQAERIVFAYEASGQGYGLSDQLEEAGIQCHVLSPNQLPKTPKGARLKTDARDAQMLLEQVRGHVLAGNPLPTVWTPSQRLRDDRELVRARIDLADELTRNKLKILSLLTRRGIEKPAWYTPRWSKRFVAFLEEQVSRLDPVVAPMLQAEIALYQTLQQQLAKLEKAIGELAKTSRYKAAHQELRKLPGVGLLTAMVFLTEMGDLSRFKNRREVGSYLGLCPASYESGEANDRKGRITRQGPSRLRKLLCQSAWVAIRYCAEMSAAYHRVYGNKKNRKKKATVAVMRKLGIKMWQKAKLCGTPPELKGRGGPHAEVETAAD